MKEIKMRPRGIGSSWLPCFICNDGDKGLKADFASFVNSRTDGEIIVDFFKKFGFHAWLDFRPQEPNWIQLKIGACDNHKAHLVELQNKIIAGQCFKEKFLKNLDKR